MKKRVSIILLLLTVLTCTSALAMTQEEWNRSCCWKTRCATAIYRLAATGTDLDGQPDEGAMEAAGTIPAGTYLGSRQHGVGNMSEMGMMIGGSIVDYYVPSDAIVKCVKTITLTDGRSYTVPELAYGHDEAVREHLRWTYSEDEINEVLRAMHGGSGEKKTEGASAKVGTVKQTAAARRSGTAKNADWQAELVGEDNGKEKVSVVNLGAYSSVIRRGDAEETVRTAQLSFGGAKADAARCVAVVATKNTGYLSLRTGDYKNAPSQGKIPDGTLVAVIKPGEAFTQVSWRGMTGYVVTSGLTWLDADSEPIGQGTLYQKGKAETSIFLAPKQDAKWIAKWPQGTGVTIVGEQGKYYEVEKDGLRGWLRKDYVKMN